MLALTGKSSHSARTFPPFPASVNTRIRDDRGGLGDDRDFVRGRLEPAAMSRKLRWSQPRRLPRDRHLDHVLEQRGRGCEQAVRQLSTIVVYDRSLADIGKGRFLCGGSPVE